MIAGLVVIVMGILWLIGAFLRPAYTGGFRAETRAIMGALLILAGVCLLSIQAAHAAAPPIPQAATGYRMKLERAAERHFGLTAPVARLAAQIQQESNWRPTARSPYAEGLAQFTPGTAKWLPGICPNAGPPDPWDPDWSVNALACYDAWLHARIKPEGDADLTPCARWAMTLSAYNGGLGWVQRDRAAAARAGDNPDAWFGGVAAVNAGRSHAAWAENRGYPQRILHRLEPAYLDAGWPGTAACP